MTRLAIRRRRPAPHRFAAGFEGLESRRLMSVAAEVSTVDLPTLYATPVPAASVQTGLEATSHDAASPPVNVVYNPAQVRRAYGFDQLPYDGAGQTIAIIDAYDNPNVASDLATFSTRFGLPQANLEQVYLDSNNQVTTTAPAYNYNWAQEIALDVQWAHAIAPAAKILLVQTASAFTTNLFPAVRYAVARGASQVSMSFGLGEFPTVSAYDTYFQNTAASYFASAGDSGAAVESPAVSPYVVGVGGTTLTLDSAGNRASETVWSGSGGATSAYVARPGYQTGFQAASTRGVPDVAYNADPNTGFYVYFTPPGQAGSFYAVGGTSAGAPQWAGLAALVNQGRTARGLGTISSGLPYGLNTALYALAGGSSYANANGDFLDITSGSNGISAGPGYDTVTGLGSPVANNLVRDLVAYGTATTGVTAPALGDPGFEAAAVGPGAFRYGPTGSAWAFAGAAGVSGNDSGFTWGNGAAPSGSQVAFLQNTGSITQAIANWAAGSYTLSLLAAQRAYSNTAAQAIQVLVDGKLVSTIAPGSTSYQSYSSAAFTVGAGSHTVTLQGINSTGDSTALVDSVAVAVASTPPAATVAAGDPGFEAAAVGPGAFRYGPTGSAWAFAGAAGVSGNDSGFTWGNGAAPSGSQVAFLQNTGSITQAIANWAAGSYTLSLLAAQRAYSNTAAQAIQVLIDGVVVATFVPSGPSYQAFTTPAFAVAGGSRTLTIRGLAAGGDSTALVDSVTLSRA